MGRIKTLVEMAFVDVASRTHKCQANARHVIEKGDRRLKVKNNRSWDHYCLACASQIIEKDIAKLNELRLLQPTILEKSVNPNSHLVSML